ncbi:MAG: site-2 protease family protein [Verrucomicrobia bacterium]|nr:site-2 protease family protein [Verrucomicrobiota bacterium]
MPTRQGSFHLFRLFGIDVFLHWSWLLVAVYQISRTKGYSTPVWAVLEYLALFAIVLTHEFGHALACRQVGGQANLILLWPFGGVAYVSPPQRPGATLWSIAAGPLVNVALFPVLTGLVFWLGPPSELQRIPITDNYRFVFTIWQINLVLLLFNMLPVYPLDGGQILRSILWYPLGRGRSLMVASIVGFCGLILALVFIGFHILRTNAISQEAIWLVILVLVIVLPNCWRGFQEAQALLRLAKAPRHDDFACPNCHAAPVAGNFWVCGQCRTAFDTFSTGATCPQCGAQFANTACMECGILSPLSEWAKPPVL